MRKVSGGFVLFLLTLLLLGAATGSGLARAQAGGRFFPETGYSLAGGFLAFWDAHGGYAVFGPPITDERAQADPAGRPYTEQYFAKAVFEFHPDLPDGHRIVLAPLGRLRLTALYHGTLPPMQENLARGTTPARFFDATGHWLGGDFLTYWLGHEGPLTLGPPLTGEISEADAITNRARTVQYFEFGELEWRPDLRAAGLSAVQTVALGRIWLPGHPAPPAGSVLARTPLPTPPRGTPTPTPLPTATATPRPPTPTPTPPARGVGQVIRFAGITGQGLLQGTVTAIREARTLHGGSAGGKFVTIFWRVANIGGSIESVGSQAVHLKDSQGRTFAAAPVDVQLDARADYGGHIYFTPIAPGTADNETLTFDVPLDAADYGLVP